MAYTVWERLVRADLGSDPADKAKVMEKAEEQFILAQDNYELAKMAIISGTHTRLEGTTQASGGPEEVKRLSRNILAG